MSAFQIIVGSMLGGTEYVAEACQETLESLGHSCELHLSPEFSSITQQDQTWLICTSTHGAGDYPDNIQEFIDDLTHSGSELAIKNFCVIGLGDSSYDTFCFAAKNIENLLLSKGCNKIIPTLTLDMSSDIDPEEMSQQWLSDHHDQLS